MVDIIVGMQATGKFFYQYGFGEKLSSVPQKRLTEIICGLDKRLRSRSVLTARRATQNKTDYQVVTSLISPRNK